MIPFRAGHRFRRAPRAAYGAAFAALAFGQAAFAGVGPDSSDPDELRTEVQIQLRKGDLQSAMRTVQRWSALPGLSDAQRAEALCREAKVRSLLGDAAGAGSDYERALTLKPGDPDASFGAALALRDDPERALPHAEQAARAAATGRRRASAQRLAGEIRLDLGDREGARSAIERALKLAPDDLYALQDMARLTADRPKEAAAYARRADRAAEAAPLWSRPEAFLLGSRVWLELKDSTGAAKSLRRALDLDPDYMDAWEALVQLKHDGATLPEAAAPAAEPAAPAGRKEDKLLRALREDPEDLEALRELIALRRGQNRPEEAAALADRFEDSVLDAPVWQQAAAYRLGVRIWLELGSGERALQTFWKARDLDSRSLAIASLGLELSVFGPTTLDALGTVVRARLDARNDASNPYDFPQPHEYGPEQRAALRADIEAMLVQGRTNEAADYAERLLYLSAKVPEALAAAYRLRALIRHELKDETGGREDFRRAAAAVPPL